MQTSRRFNHAWRRTEALTEIPGGGRGAKPHEELKSWRSGHDVVDDDAALVAAEPGAAPPDRNGRRSPVFCQLLSTRPAAGL